MHEHTAPASKKSKPDIYDEAGSEDNHDDSDHVEDVDDYFDVPTRFPPTEFPSKVLPRRQNPSAGTGFQDVGLRIRLYVGFPDFSICHSGHANAMLDFMLDSIMFVASTLPNWTAKFVASILPSCYSHSLDRLVVFAPPSSGFSPRFQDADCGSTIKLDSRTSRSVILAMQMPCWIPPYRTAIFEASTPPSCYSHSLDRLVVFAPPSSITTQLDSVCVRAQLIGRTKPPFLIEAGMYHVHKGDSQRQGGLATLLQLALFDNGNPPAAYPTLPGTRLEVGGSLGSNARPAQSMTRRDCHIDVSAGRPCVNWTVSHLQNTDALRSVTSVDREDYCQQVPKIEDEFWKQGGIKKVVLEEFKIDPCVDSDETGVEGTVAGILALSPPTKANLVQSPAGALDLQVGIVADDAVGRRVFLGDLPFPPPLHSVAAPYSLQSPSSALATSLLMAAQISSLAHSREWERKHFGTNESRFVYGCWEKGGGGGSSTGWPHYPVEVPLAGVEEPRPQTGLVCLGLTCSVISPVPGVDASGVRSLATGQVLPHTWKRGIRFLFPCKSAIGSESSRTCIISSDPIAKAPHLALHLALQGPHLALEAPHLALQAPQSSPNAPHLEPNVLHQE
ncbi:hypothetical protein PR048_020506 [Dryococelus australis]|uniref:Uncharacterized protein n=1 Tax=Dryococelus australis TaxID=614101 RepID=A0ABQ9H6G1_9NEOP|nr:hypothetical protein PR048_020506 [Dryococelus australis]